MVNVDEPGTNLAILRLESKIANYTRSAVVLNTPSARSWVSFIGVSLHLLDRAFTVFLSA